MTRHTRCASLGLTVGTRLMARDTVAVDTRARLATSWMFNACSLVRTVQTLMWTSNLARLLYARLERSHTGSGSVSGLPTKRELHGPEASSSRWGATVTVYRASLRGSGLQVKDSVAVGDFAAGIRKAA